MVSLLNPALEYKVTVRQKLVDATLTETKVPATNQPSFAVAAGVNCVPVNGLSHVARPWERYCVVGGGKTGIDAVLHLLDHGTDPARISWIVSNDNWFVNRDIFDIFFSADGMWSFMEPILEASSRQEALHNLERAGHLLRLDPGIEPQRCRGASVSREELARLTGLGQIVRENSIIA